MRTWMGFLLGAALLAASPASAGMKLTYGDWASETPHERELVIAAVIDGLTGITHTDTLGTWTKHFAKCIEEKQMTNADLVTGIDEMVAASNSSYGPNTKLLVTLTHYLEAQCGKPMNDAM